MKLKGKRHQKLQEKALDKAILELVGPWGDYDINDIENTINFNFKREKIKCLENLEFNLPSLDEIKKLAKKKYKKFDCSSINKIIYNFNFLGNSVEFGYLKNLTLVAKDSDIVLNHSNFNKVDIQSEGKVMIQSCSIDSDINIKTKTLGICNCTKLNFSCVNINTEFVYFNRVYMINDLNVNSQLISFTNSDFMNSKNINLKADMIDCKNSKLKAQNKIEIINTNCDEIIGVDAPIIIYNGQNIIYSEGIVVPKLKSNLIEVLRKVRSNIIANLDNKLEVEIKKLKRDLNNQQIIKILKK